MVGPRRVEGAREGEWEEASETLRWLGVSGRWEGEGARERGPPSTRSAKSVGPSGKAPRASQHQDPHNTKSLAQAAPVADDWFTPGLTPLYCHTHQGAHHLPSRARRTPLVRHIPITPRDAKLIYLTFPLLWPPQAWPTVLMHHSCIRPDAFNRPDAQLK